jgi:hypothetical protein
MEGNISNFHYVDNLARAIRHTGRILLDLIPKIYDTDRIINIVQPDGKEEKVRINAPYIDPKTQKEKMYNLTAGKYDVIVDIGPSYATQRQEAVQSMLDFVEGDPQLKSLLGDLIAKNMDWQDSDEVSKRLQTLLPAGVIADENPQVKAVINQAQQQVQMMQGYVSQLEEAIKQRDLALQNKEGELAVKQQEQIRKLQETIGNLQQGQEKLTQEWAKIELNNQHKQLDILNKGVQESQVKPIN